MLLFIVLPFNISIQVYLGGTNPYVNGIFTNYLVPTVSILDLFACLFLVSSIFERKIHKEDLSCELILLVLFSLLQFLLKDSMVSLLGIFRIVSYLLVFKVTIREIKMKGDMKVLRILETLIVIQAGIAILQFVKGSSIGLSFLGESVFSSGMKGSNFIDISGNLYIRGYGTFPHPNILAGWLLMNMTILWKYRKGFVSLIISSVGVILTFSRLAIFLMIIFWIMYIYEYLKDRYRYKLFSLYGMVSGRIFNLFNGGYNVV